MPIIEFETGEQVEFELEPTEQEIDDAAKALRIGIYQEKPGLFQSTIQSAVRPIARPLASLHRAGTTIGSLLESATKSLSGKKEEARRIFRSAQKNIDAPYDLGYLGQVKPLRGVFEDNEILPSRKGLAEAAGIGAQLGAYATPIGGIFKGGLTGAALGAGTALEEGKSTRDVGVATATGFGTGAAFRVATKGVEHVLPRLLKGSAERSVAKAFGATEKGAKQEVAKITPRFLEKKVTALTRRSLQEKALTALDKTGELYDEAFKGMVPGRPVGAGSVKNILNTLEKAKAEFIVEGTKVVADKSAIQNLTAMQGLIKKLGKNVSYESLKNLRQILDKGVVAGGKTFGRTLAENSKLYAQRQAANAIRNELGELLPSIAKINAEYSFWSSVSDIIGKTLERTKGQAQPLGRTILQSGTAAGGIAAGLNLLGILKYPALVASLHLLMTSTGWRTVSAITKNTLAKALASGSFDVVADIVGRLTAQQTSRRLFQSK